MADGVQWRVPVSEIYPGTLRGYRQFRFRRHHNLLRPMSQLLFSSYEDHDLYEGSSGTWFSAKCSKYHNWHKDHKAPYTDCDCGFYINYAPGQAFFNFTRKEATSLSGGYYSHVYPELLRSVVVYAVVEAAGKIVLSQKGFRAEKMRVIAYHSPEDLTVGNRLLPPITENPLKGLPEYKKLKHLLKEYPQIDLSDLIGKENYKRAVRAGKFDAFGYQHPIINPVLTILGKRS